MPDGTSAMCLAQSYCCARIVGPKVGTIDSQGNIAREARVTGGNSCFCRGVIRKMIVQSEHLLEATGRNVDRQVGADASGHNQ